MLDSASHLPMAIKAAINGFGRIGRIAFRVGILRHLQDIDFVAINTSGSMDASGWAHMLRYDSVYGVFEKEVKVENTGAQEPEIGAIVIEGKRIPILAERDPAKIPWKRYGADVVIESTGVFRTEEASRAHLQAGAKRVIISAPERGGNVGTYLIGVNEGEYKKEQEIISNASCTTNCVAPCAAVMVAAFGVKKALLSTVHSYTASQELTDGSGKDLRRARAAAANIVLTTTGAAEATTKAIKELEGLFDGIAIRVPVLNGSVADFTFLTEKPTTVEQVNQAFRDAASSERWKGIIAVVEDPIVSQDIIGRSESAIVDLAFTRVVAGDLVKILAWYDNEWGYASRLVEQTINVGKTLAGQ